MYETPRLKIGLVLLGSEVIEMESRSICTGYSVVTARGGPLAGPGSVR